MSDQEYKDLLESWEEQPPQHVWNAIEKAIEAPAPHWYAKTWIQVAVIGIIGISAWLVYNHNTQKASDSNSISAPSSSNTQQIKPGKDEIAPSAKPGKDGPAQTESQNNPNEPNTGSQGKNTGTDPGTVAKKTDAESEHNSSQQNPEASSRRNSVDNEKDAGQAPAIAASTVKLRLSETVTCEGKAIQVKVTGGAAGQVLDFGDGHYANITGASTTLPYIYTIAGKYMITVKQGNIQLADQHINIISKPIAGFTTSVEENTRVRFINTSSNATKFYWIFGDGTVGNQAASVEHFYQSTSRKQFHVKLIAVNTISGCSDSFDMDVKNPNFKNYFSLPIPNVFTPNNDGINDVFEIPAAELIKWHLIVVDGSGNKVFETDDQKNYWNGTVNNKGTECAAGSYRYYIYYKQPDDTEEHQKSGMITLIR
jgi:gliding motility-associated-like protein